MAEAIELNLPLGEGGTESVEKIIKPLLDLENKKQKSENTDQYDIECFYTGDSLGSDVLKQKYLAHNEKHPYEMEINEFSDIEYYGSNPIKKSKNKNIIELNDIIVPEKVDWRREGRQDSY